jgi:hypothetical protein
VTDYSTVLMVNAQGSNVLSWQVHARLVSDGAWEEVFTGTGPATNASVPFDPTLRLNGLWGVRPR